MTAVLHWLLTQDIINAEQAVLLFLGSWLAFSLYVFVIGARGMIRCLYEWWRQDLS